MVYGVHLYPIHLEFQVYLLQLHEIPLGKKVSQAPKPRACLLLSVGDKLKVKKYPSQKIIGDEVFSWDVSWVYPLRVS